MKKVGIIGGMGPESTIPYYHDIVYGVQKKLGKNCFPNLTIESVDVFKVLGFCAEEKYEELVEYLMEAIHCLERCGVDFIILAANTPHIVFEQLVERSLTRLVSIIEETAKYAEEKQVKRLGLIGTPFTMKGQFYRTPFEEKQLELILPTEEEMAYLGNKIGNELELGIVKEDTKAGIYQIIERMKREDEIEGIILGCTELPLAVNEEESPVPCFDTMKIHIASVVEEICS